jgi:hypothetical protein
LPFDAITALAEAGQPVDSLSDSELELISSLSPVEVAAINNIKARLEVVSDDDVEAHHPNGNNLL